MIGGLIYEQTSSQTQKIPVLGAIPVLGRAFQTDGAVKTRSELEPLARRQLYRPQVPHPVRDECEDPQEVRSSSA